MKAAILCGDRDIRIESLEKPKCGKGEVLTKTLYCGICGSDPPRVYDGDRNCEPREAMGHEFSAIVEEVGEGVTKFKVGDMVAIAPLVVCHKCKDCMTGNYGQCKNSTFIGACFPDKGGFVEYNTINEANLVKVPAGTDPVKAAFVEPVSVALHGLLIAGLKPGIDIAVVGAGTIGQLVLQGAKALGAGRIFVFDMNPERLELAKKMGAYAVYNTQEEGFLDKFFAETDGRGVKQIVEAVGAPATIELCIKIADVEANIALIGTMHKDVTLSPDVFYYMFSKRQLHMHGVWMSYSEDFPGVEWRLAIQLIAEGKIELEPLIDRVIDIDDVAKNLDDYLIPNKVKGKMMVRMTPEK